MFDSEPAPFKCCHYEPYEGDRIQNLIQANKNHEIKKLRSEDAELPISGPQKEEMSIRGSRKNYIYIYIYIYRHTHTQTYTQAFSKVKQI